MIIANQTLHGYANGHQMIASSHDWSLDERKKMDVLSDLNGRCDERENQSYYTGYPLADGKKYVISKTWYAYEMPRPGCVWTHSIIFNIEDISKIKNVDEVIRTFHRPLAEEYKRYTGQIQFEDGEHTWEDYDVKLLEYLIYTIYGTANPRIIYFENDNNIIKELLFCLQIMPCQLLRFFSFCTMSYEGRVYNGKPFSYQVTTKDYAEVIKRRNQALEICVPYKSVEKMPYWVKCYYDYAQNGMIKELYRFVLNYGEDFYTWENFNGFIRIFFLLQNKRDLCVQEYFNFLTQVMEKQGKELIQKTVELLLEDSFFTYSFENVEYQILETVDMDSIRIDKKQKNRLYNKILSGHLECMFAILCKYKEGKLKQGNKNIVEDIVARLDPMDLKCVSHMNEDICVVLVHMNQKLLLSEDIWKSDRAFQIMLLYSAGKWNDLQSLKELLQLIIDKDKDNIAYEFYSIYGDTIIPLLLEIMQNETVDKISLRYWYPIIKKKPVELLNALTNFQSNELCKTLFYEVDKHDKKIVEDIHSNVWEALFDKMCKEENNKEQLMRLYFEYMLVIFSTNKRLKNELVEKVVHPIYKKMLNNAISMDEWNYFQYLLPEVEPCYSWDKCLRMREALNIRGYNIKDINC